MRFVLSLLAQWENRKGIYETGTQDGNKCKSRSETTKQNPHTARMDMEFTSGGFPLLFNHEINVET